MYNEYLTEELLFEYKGKNGGGEQRTHNPILLRFLHLKFNFHLICLLVLQGHFG